MRERRHHVELAITPDKAFALLITPSAIRGWWSAARAIVLPREGGFWAAAWGENEDDPDYVSVARLRVFDPPRRLVFGDYAYHARSGPLPFQADFSTEFTIEPKAAGCILRVCQSGFPDDPVADGFYAACETGWRNTFAGIQRFMRSQHEGALP